MKALALMILLCGCAGPGRNISSDCAPPAPSTERNAHFQDYERCRG